MAAFHIAFYKLADLLLGDLPGFFALARLYSEYYTAMEKVDGVPEVIKLADLPDWDTMNKYEPKAHYITDAELTDFALYQMQKLFGEIIDRAHRTRIDD